MLVSTTAERLKQIMELRGLRQIDIVRLCEPYCRRYRVKMGRNTISQYVSGKVVPRQNALYILGLALGVSEAWLMGGDVPPERKEKSAPAELPTVLKKFNELNEIGQSKAEAYLDGLLENPDYKRSAEGGKKAERAYTTASLEDTDEARFAAFGGLVENDDTAYTS